MSVAVAAVVPVVALALLWMTISILMAMAAAYALATAALMELASTSVAAAMVVAELAAAAVVAVAAGSVAAVVVVAAESAALAAAVSADPSPAGPRSVLPQEPKRWLRDSSLGRAPRLRPRPSLCYWLRIPEPRYLQPDSSLVDLAPECRPAEAVSVSVEELGQLTR